MPSKVLRESYCWSKSLSSCSHDTEDRFPRILLFGDDWGCFEVDLMALKGRYFPKRQDVTVDDLRRHLNELKDNGMLFLWIDKESGKLYGFFVNHFKYESFREARRHKRKTPEPPEDLLAKYLEHFKLPLNDTECQGLTTNPYPLSLSPPLSLEKKEPAASPVHLSTNVETPQEQVEDFLDGKSGFGRGGNEKDRQFRDEVKKCCVVYAGRHREWGEEIDEEDKFVNKKFGMMLNLIRHGVPKIPKGVLNFKGNYTPPEIAIELINSLSKRKPDNPDAQLIDAFRKQPKYRK